MNEPVMLTIVALTVKSLLQAAWLCLGRSRERERDRTLLRLVRNMGKGGWVADHRGDGRVFVVWTRGAEVDDYQNRNTVAGKAAIEAADAADTADVAGRKA